MALTLSSDIATAFAAAAADPAVAGAIGSDAHPLGGWQLATPQADRRLAELVRLYQQGERPTWAPVLLEAMAPALIPWLAMVNGEPPYVDREDVAQQLVVEVLEEALNLDLGADATHVAQRLLRGAAARVAEQLKEEARWRRRLRQLPPADDSEEV